ncbi:MAG: hypothetical protein ACI4OP_01495 [Candidatus Coprovivens sp.]
MAQTTSVLWSVDQGLGEKAKEQARQNIGAASEKLTEVVNNHTEKIEANTTEIGQIKDDVAGIESALLNKKDKQSANTFIGSSTKTIKNILQDENGELNVEFEDIDLPQEVPNIEITSEDNSVKVIETTDTQTNTKKFDLSVDVDDKIPDPSTSNPLMAGTASVGLSSKYAREDHVHPSDTSKEAVSNKTSVVLGTSNSKYPTDKAVADFVNSSIATNTANYISNNGEPFTSLEQLEAYTGTVTNNDYAFVTGTDSAGNTYYDRYKATVSESTVTWALEYRLNNSSFTAAQWAAINSGVTSDKVNYWDGKQDALTFDGTYNGSNNKAATVSSITSRINNLDAAVTSTDGINVQVKVTQTDGKVTDVNITEDNTASMDSVSTLSNTVSNLTYQVQANTDELASIQSKKVDIVQLLFYSNTGNTTVLDKKFIGNNYKEYAGNIGFTTTSSGNMSICAFDMNNELIYKNQCVSFSGPSTDVTNFIPFIFKETGDERISYIGIKGSSTNSNANITHLFYIGKTE